jgi:D-alanyl-D-alanine carboxypeptidase
LRGVALALCFVLLAATPHPIQGDLAYQLGLDASQLVTAHAAPSVSVAVVENGAIAFTHAAGAATPDSVYAIGSVTKMFTAVSVFQLIEQGSVSLDDPLAKFLPNFPNAKNITVRQLLSHQAGINDYVEAAVRDGLVYRPTTPDAIVAMIAAASPQFAPGTGWRYSNGGYVLLGKIVETVTHEALVDYEREHIFKVAGMQQTDVGQAAAGLDVAPPFLAIGWYAKLAQPDYSWYYACGDILSTASDLARFDIALMAGKLISPASFAAMQRVAHEHTILPDTADGLGLFIRPMAGKTFVGHHGGEPGYTSDNEMIPADGFAVVILDNGFAQTDDTLSSIVHALYWTSASQYTVALKLFQNFFAGLQTASIDRSKLTPDMSAALTPAFLAKGAPVFRGWGAIKTADYQSEADEHGLTTYIVRLTCTNAAHVVRFSIDDHTKKLAGFYYND